ncbi:MAG: porin [Sphingomonadales bacterium]|nr:porin [Sphingomonadales bacterium]
MTATVLAGSPAEARKAAHRAAPSGIEARLAKMEAEIAQLKTDLAEARAGQAQAEAAAQAASSAAEAASTTALAASSAAASADAKASKAATGLATLEKKPAPEGFRDGGSTVRLGGYLKLVASNSHWSNGSVATNTLGRDFYLPQTIPTTVGGKGFTSQDFTAKQARLWLNLDTTVAGHVVKGYLETDFQTTSSAVQNVTAGGSQRTTNGYTLALRRAYVTLDKFTFGQDWTTFQYTAALPETTDYVGGAEGTVFVRQPQVRFSQPLGHGLTLHVAAENPESALVSAGATATLESGTDHLPDFTARLAYAGKRGELSFAGLLRQVRGESNGSALVNNTTTAAVTGTGVTATGIGGSIGGKLFLAEDKSSDVRFIATYGKDIGRYVGLQFAPDAVYNPATNKLTDVSVFAALVAARYSLTPQLRINVMGSYQHVGYDKGLTLAQTSGLNKQAWSMAANLFYSPVKAVDLGIEYRHGERTVINSATASGDAKGKLDRVEFAAKYSF